MKYRQKAERSSQKAENTQPILLPPAFCLLPSFTSSLIPHPSSLIPHPSSLIPSLWTSGQRIGYTQIKAHYMSVFDF